MSTPVRTTICSFQINFRGNCESKPKENMLELAFFIYCLRGRFDATKYE